MRSEMANRLVSVSLGQLRAQADSIDATLLAELERAGLIEQRGGKWCCTERGHNFAPRYMAMRHGRWCIDGPTLRRSGGLSFVSAHQSASVAKRLAKMARAQGAKQAKRTHGSDLKAESRRALMFTAQWHRNRKG